MSRCYSLADIGSVEETAYQKLELNKIIIHSIKIQKNMEPKKVKKLVVNSETIANLSDNEMSKNKGGAGYDCYTCDWECFFRYTNYLGACFGRVPSDYNSGGGGGWDPCCEPTCCICYGGTTQTFK